MNTNSNWSEYLRRKQDSWRAEENLISDTGEGSEDERIQRMFLLCQDRIETGYHLLEIMDAEESQAFERYKSKQQVSTKDDSAQDLMPDATRQAGVTLEHEIEHVFNDALEDMLRLESPTVGLSFLLDLRRCYEGLSRVYTALADNELTSEMARSAIEVRYRLLPYHKDKRAERLEIADELGALVFTSGVDFQGKKMGVKEWGIAAQNHLQSHEIYCELISEEPSGQAEIDGLLHTTAILIRVFIPDSDSRERQSLITAVKRALSLLEDKDQNGGLTAEQAEEYVQIKEDSSKLI